ncbi:MAG: hypothetical protein Q8O55_11445 [Dehalococcoidales bacterium]|nr:hypothetical protein [Dehalococcoidales bacterium]
MKLTNGEIYMARDPLRGDPLGRLMAVKWPVRTSMNLVNLARKINNQFMYICEVRDGLIKKHGIIDEKTKQPMVRVDSEAWPVFKKEHEELMAEEVEIEVIPFALPEMVAATCDKCGHNMDRPCEIEGATLIALGKFLMMS